MEGLLFHGNGGVGKELESPGRGEVEPSALYPIGVELLWYEVRNLAIFGFPRALGGLPRDIFPHGTPRVLTHGRGFVFAS